MIVSRRNRVGSHACRVVVAVAAVLLTGAAPALAVVPKPSASFTKEVTEACIKASDLHRAKAVGKPIEFDDQIGMTALLIEGDVMLSRTKSRKGRVLCLFDKVTRNAFVGDATGLMTPTRR